MSPGQQPAWPVTGGVLELGDFPAERGGVIAGARLAWQAHGTLNGERDNVIVYPCSYAASHADLAWLIGPDGVLDPARWFIVVPDMFSSARVPGQRAVQRRTGGGAARIRAYLRGLGSQPGFLP